MNTTTAVLELAPVQPGEHPMKQVVVWEDFRAKAEKLKTTALTLTITDVSDRAGMALARTTRLALKEVRVAVTRRHKELKEDILVEGRRIDAGKNELLAMIEPLETRLLDQEQFAERELARIQREKRESRTAELTPFLSAPIAVDLGLMDDDDYSSLLLDAKSAHAAKLERERKEKEEIKAKAKAEAEERERIRLEVERLRKEAVELEAAVQKEREATAAALAKEREESAERDRVATAKAEAAFKKLQEESAERQRVAAAKAKSEAAKAQKEREAIEAKAKADREARENLEAEVAAKKAAEEKEAAEKADAEKAAAMAPEKDKLNKFAADVRSLPLPTMATTKGASYMKEVSVAMERLAEWIERKALTL